MANRYADDAAVRDDVVEKVRAGYMNAKQFREQFEEGLRQDLRTTPILCFYPDWGSLPMWAHYAATASGFAIGVDFSEPWEGMFYPLPVTYTNDRPVLDLSEDIVEDNVARQRHLERVFLTKSDVWVQFNSHGRERLPSLACAMRISARILQRRNSVTTRGYCHGLQIVYRGSHTLSWVFKA